jgi:hypothetical protein
MASISELVTAQNIAAYWEEKNQNAQPLLGETLFPKKKRLGTKLEWIKGANNQPVALRTSTFDAKAIRRDREGIDQFDTKMPFFKESKYIDEEMRQDLNNLIASNNQEVINAILTNIYDDEAELIDASEISLERMRMEALTTGTITLADNGQSYEYDYLLEANQKVTSTSDWSSAAADILGDIVKVVEDARARGVVITRAVCNSSVAKNFRTNTAIKNAVYVFANGTVPVTTARALDYIFNETGVRFYVYDNVYVNESKQAVKYVPDDTVVFMADGDLGYTNMGTTPEESDLRNNLNANVAIVNGGVAVTTSQIVDPVNVETKVSMVALPSFEKANNIVILDADGSSL